MIIPPFVCRPCVRSSMRLCVNFLFKQLLWNHWLDLTKLPKNDPWVVPFKSCSKNSIWNGTLVAMATNWKNFKNLLLQTHKAQSLDILHMALSIRPLSSLFKLWYLWSNWIVFQRNIVQNFEISSPDSLGTDLRYFACGIVQWTSIKFVQIMVPDSNCPRVG